MSIIFSVDFEKKYKCGIIRILEEIECWRYLIPISIKMLTNENFKQYEVRTLCNNCLLNVGSKLISLVLIFTVSNRTKRCREEKRSELIRPTEYSDVLISCDFIKLPTLV